MVSIRVAAIEFSPALRHAASHVAAVHIWSAPVPQDRPPRSFLGPLLLAAVIATAGVTILDAVLIPMIAAFHRQPNGLWFRSAVLLGVWKVFIIVLQPWFERRAERKLQSDAASMQFATARALVVAQLARKPEDPHALEKLRAADAYWFRSTTK